MTTFASYTKKGIVLSIALGLSMGTMPCMAADHARILQILRPYIAQKQAQKAAASQTTNRSKPNKSYFYDLAKQAKEHVSNMFTPAQAATKDAKIAVTPVQPVVEKIKPKTINPNPHTD